MVLRMRHKPKLHRAAVCARKSANRKTRASPANRRKASLFKEGHGSVNEPAKVWTRDQVSGEKRDAWTALKRGLRGRCPRCGKGKLFRAFLKVDDHCPV